MTSSSNCFDLEHFLRNEIFGDRLLGIKGGLSLFWLGLAAIACLALLPWLLRIYLQIAFYSLGGLIVSAIFVFTGYELNTKTPTTQKADVKAGTTETASSKAAVVSSEKAAIERTETPASRTAIAREPAIEISADDEPQVVVNHAYAQMRERIEGLLTHIRGREEVNLGIGMLFSLAGVIVLAFLVFWGVQTTNDRNEFFYWFLPRLSVALFIQLFAYFFLRLYRENLLDFKYFNNELTNIEFKKLATDLSLRSEARNSPVLAQICGDLIKVERNFVLRKGETAAITHDENSTRSESELLQNIRELSTAIKAMNK